MLFRMDALFTTRAAATLIWTLGALAALPAWSDTGGDEVPTVSVAAPAYWCPYACDAAGPRWGFAVDIALTALGSSGYSVKYRNLPYDRALVEARVGRVDTTLPTFRDEAPDFVFPEHAVSSTEYCFYLPEDRSWRYAGPDSLHGIDFVATSGYSYGKKIDAYIATHREKSVTLIQGEDIPERLQKMVRMGRYDALLEDRLLFESSQSSDGLVNAGCLEERHAGYLALSPQNPERSRTIAEAFDRGFERIRASGRICEILRDYGLSAHYVPNLGEEDCPE